MRKAILMFAFASLFTVVNVSVAAVPACDDCDGFALVAAVPACDDCDGVAPASAVPACDDCDGFQVH